MNRKQSKFSPQSNQNVQTKSSLSRSASAYRTIEHRVDICVVGGGLAGLCAAIAAARHGARVLIMQDRPMFGGNASSEIRMWVCGAHGANNRETGILEEIMLENYWRNPYKNYSIWDSILYEKVRFQEDLSYEMNCSCLDAEMDGARIASITGWQGTTQRFHRVQADLFLDCSGDSVLAPLSGADYRVGRESRAEFGEDIAPEAADRRTMGMSCLIQTRECSAERVFIAPDWAEKMDAAHLAHRRPDPLRSSENYWYLELGGEQDSIADTESIRDELQDIAYGLWDSIKNGGDFPEAARLDLDWIGILPGKRESRRYVGDVIVTQHDVRSGGHFPDLVAYGGWTMDDHHPGGFRASEPPTIFHPAPSPFGLPYRALYSRNIVNLMFAGRNISVTHTAMSASRVMGTCAVLGQAVGTAAALAIREQTSPRGVYENHLDELQRQLMEDDCYLPFRARPIPELSLKACYQVDGRGAEQLRNGLDRQIGRASNAWSGKPGDRIELVWEKPQRISSARLVLDSDLDRKTLPEQESRDNRPMNASYPLHPKAAYLPKTLLRDFELQSQDEPGNWRNIAVIRDNRRRLVILPLNIRTAALRLIVGRTWGLPAVRIFSFDVQ